MPYDWEEAASGEGQTALIPLGVQKVTGSKVIFGRGDEPFLSRDGDPQILLVVEDEEGNEASTFFTLSKKAAWALAVWLRAAGAPLDELKKRGMEPKHFADPKVAEKFLIGKSLWVRVEAGKDPKYRNLHPLREDQVPVEGAETEDEPDLDSELDFDGIPF